MRFPWLAVSAAASFVTASAYPSEQHPLAVVKDSDWINTPPSKDDTSNLIFHSLYSLLQHWSAIRHVNGHSVVFGTVPVGTVFYHGRGVSDYPKSPEWLAFDIEHSYIFCRSDCFIFNYAVVKELRVVYLDGSSAVGDTRGTKTGSLDTQELIMFGEIRDGRDRRENAGPLCEWAKKHDIDGFVRTEMDNEIVYCDFEGDKLEVVSRLNLVNAQGDRPGGPGRGPGGPGRGPGGPGGHWPGGPGNPGEPGGPGGPGGPKGAHPREGYTHATHLEAFDLPDGWIGSPRARQSVGMEAMEAGSWHNFYPGENRVQLDASKMVTFYDPALTSLVEARRNTTKRDEHNLSGISNKDLQFALDQISDAMTRKQVGSGVDWVPFTKVIIDRYGQRIEYLQHILNEPLWNPAANITATTIRARAHVLMMINPYLVREAVPGNSTTSTWVEPMYHHCATTLTSRLPTSLYTYQEKVLHQAVQGTLNEICRTLSLLWVSAVGIEAKSQEEMASALDSWRGTVADLMQWLDWPDWVRCDPECGKDALCILPQWPYWGSGPIEMVPTCRQRNTTEESSHL